MILYFTQKEQDKQCFKFWPKIQTICHSNVCCDILLLQPSWTNILDLVKKTQCFVIQKKIHLTFVNLSQICYTIMVLYISDKLAAMVVLLVSHFNKQSKTDDSLGNDSQISVKHC